jgi:hypothetical protein
MARMDSAKAQRLLAECAEQSAFFCHNGEQYLSLRQLQRGLVQMSENAFKHHVNAEKNDFATWIRDVIGDSALARDLSETQSQGTALRRVSQRVALLESRV